VPPRTKPNAKRSASDASLEADALELYRTMTAYNRFQQFRDRDHSGYHGLTITQCYVLEHVAGREGVTLNDLVLEMLLDKSTLSRVVDKLEAKGAIVRRPNPADGRSSLITLTASGAKAYRAWVGDLVTQNVDLMRELPAGQRRQFLDFLRRLTDVALNRNVERIAV
jgi:DNA-binding MarR family transcriptional regulator